MFACQRGMVSGASATPSTRISPELGCSSPMIRSMIVLLPLPVLPISPTRDPFGMMTEILFNTALRSVP